jgi:hypothetical protein
MRQMSRLRHRKQVGGSEAVPAWRVASRAVPQRPLNPEGEGAWQAAGGMGGASVGSASPPLDRACLTWSQGTAVHNTVPEDRLLFVTWSENDPWNFSDSMLGYVQTDGFFHSSGLSGLSLGS